MRERLQKIVSEYGIASRRKAEEMIKEARVRVNGEVAHLGDSADKELDIIEVDGVRLGEKDERRYIILNKPVGYVTTMSDEKDRKTVVDLVKDAGTRLYPVGRLDMFSEGLLVMTNDGELANKLMHPSHNVEKVYRVWVSGMAMNRSLEQMKRPMEIDGVMIRPARIEVLQVKAGGTEALIEVGISEGRNRQIRKMCEISKLRVNRLMRVSEGELKLGDLEQGTWRDMTDAELSYLKNLSK